MHARFVDALELINIESIRIENEKAEYQEHKLRSHSKTEQPDDGQ